MVRDLARGRLRTCLLSGQASRRQDSGSSECRYDSERQRNSRSTAGARDARHRDSRDRPVPAHATGISAVDAGEARHRFAQHRESGGRNANEGWRAPQDGGRGGKTLRRRAQNARSTEAIGAQRQGFSADIDRPAAGDEGLPAEGAGKAGPEQGAAGHHGEHRFRGRAHHTNHGLDVGRRAAPAHPVAASARAAPRWRSAQAPGRPSSRRARSGGQRWHSRRSSSW